MTNAYKSNLDIAYIGLTNPKTGIAVTRTITIDSPFHPRYKEPPHDFGESIIVCECGRDDCEECSYDY